jgi:hypothetical protein
LTVAGAVISMAFMARTIRYSRYILPLFAIVVLFGRPVVAATVLPDDCTRATREAARTWGLNRIALIEAANGDVVGAKNTLSQVDDDDPPPPMDVTTVWFCNRMPSHEHRFPMPCPNPVWQAFDNRGRQPAGIPDRAPFGLQSDYLAADPRHGQVIDFTYEYDPNGMRMTSRK